MTFRCAPCALDGQVGTIEPHVFVELYAGEGDPEYFNEEEHTQVTNGCQLGPNRAVTVQVGQPHQDCPYQPPASKLAA